MTETPMPPEEINSHTLLKRARNARADNAAYLALPAPSALQRNAQIEALTRQMQTVLRLLISDLSDTD